MKSVLKLTGAAAILAVAVTGVAAQDIDSTDALGVDMENRLFLRDDTGMRIMDMETDEEFMVFEATAENARPEECPDDAFWLMAGESDTPENKEFLVSCADEEMMFGLSMPETMNPDWPEGAMMVGPRETRSD